MLTAGVGAKKDPGDNVPGGQPSNDAKGGHPSKRLRPDADQPGDDAAERLGRDPSYRPDIRQHNAAMLSPVYAKIREILEPILLTRKLKGSDLPLKFHVDDLVGCDR